jgi:LmbE family N-acetylglucosaminyl deacetylase
MLPWQRLGDTHSKLLLPIHCGHMNYQPEGFSTDPAEDSPLETLRISTAIRELNNSDYGNVGHRSHTSPLPSAIEGSNLRFLRSPTGDLGHSLGSPPRDDCQSSLSSGLDRGQRTVEPDRGIPAPSRQSVLDRGNTAAPRVANIDRARSGCFLLASPEALPMRDLTQIARHRVTIVAPHPDDETLGCGGAISLLCRKGYDVRVLVISDGTLSHPNSRKYPPHALQSIRARETQRALGILGVNRSAITFLGLKDGSVPTLTSANFQTAKARCQNYLRAARPDTIFLPWRFDPHADHRATWQLLEAAMLGLDIAPQKIEYPIWDWDLQQQQQVPNLERITGWRLDIGTALDRKLNAISAYRSQLGLLIDDDPTGFCLTADLLTNFTRPWEVYFEETL